MGKCLRSHGGRNSPDQSRRASRRELINIKRGGKTTQMGHRENCKQNRKAAMGRAQRGGGSGSCKTSGNTSGRASGKAAHDGDHIFLLELLELLDFLFGGKLGTDSWCTIIREKRCEYIAEASIRHAGGREWHECDAPIKFTYTCPGQICVAGERGSYSESLVHP